MKRLLAKLKLEKRQCVNCKYFRADLGEELLGLNPVFRAMTNDFTPDRFSRMQAEAQERLQQERLAQPPKDDLERLGRVVVVEATQEQTAERFTATGFNLSGEKWTNLGVCQKHEEGVFPSYSCEDWD